MLKETVNPIDILNFTKQDFPNKPPEFLYPVNYKEKIILDSDMPSSVVPFKEIIGHNANRRYNVCFLNEQEIITAISNTFQIINIETKKRIIYKGTESGGIGSIALHPSKKYFAVAECGEWPNIYIYQYKSSDILTEDTSSIALYRILRKGSEKSYTALAFDSAGEKLASVGGDPEYSLLVWNWMNESIILKAKAFSQEIFRVQFSNNIEGKLITSGIGHIKFWEMAKTFTGLKLQGELGKFGQIDLSDISAFLEFPDGKVLSGTEYGTFLLWEGIFIKAHFSISQETKCHTGPIEYMAWEENTGLFVSAGHDGYMKWWSSDETENANVDDNYTAYMKPVKERLLVNPVTILPVKIINVIKTEKFLFVQDGNGYFLKATPSGDKYKIENVYEFHSGPVIKVSFLLNSPYILTQGSDSKTCLKNLKFLPSNFTFKIMLENLPELTASSCDLLPRENEDDPFVMVIGYSIGIFRIYQLDNQKHKLEMINQIKAHGEEIIKILFSPDKSYVLSSTNKEIFIFLVVELDKIIPHCCIQKSQLEQIVDIDWHIDSQRILVGLSSGYAEEIEIPKTFENSKTYIITEYNSRKYAVKLAEEQLETEDDKKKKLRKKVKKDKTEPCPAPILTCKYVNLYKEGDFLLTASKPYNNSLYLCSFDESNTNPQKRPLNFWKLPATETNYKEYFIKYISKRFIITSNNKGAVQIRSLKLIDKYIEIFPNLHSNSVQDVSLSWDERLISISYKDGTILIYQINLEAISNYVETFLLPEDDPRKHEFVKEHDPRAILSPVFAEDEENLFKKIQKSIFSQDNEKLKKKKEDLISMNSIEDQKQNEQRIQKLQHAEDKKNKLRAKIYKLREDYEKIVVENESLDEEIRLLPEEMVVDEDYLKIVYKERQENFDDIKHKYDWLKANIEVTINKHVSFFLESEKTPKICLFSLNTNEYVSTIRCPNLPITFIEDLNKVNSQIEDFRSKIGFSYLDLCYKPFIEVNDGKNEKEDDYVQNLISQIDNRVENFSKSENDKTVVKRADVHKTEINEELEFTKIDQKQIESLIKEKKDAKKLFTQIEKNSPGKQGRRFSHNGTTANRTIDKCPDSYTLKMSYDQYYTEENMKTVFIYKKLIYDFIKMLYDQRNEYNRRVMELRTKKEELIKTLKSKKNELIELNKQLSDTNDNEKLDWLEFNFIESKEYPEKDLIVKEDELQKYVSEKVVDDKELKEMFLNRSGVDNSLQTKVEVQESNINPKESNQIVLAYGDRKNKKINETNIESELRSLNYIKNSHKKKKLIQECKNLIEEFDKEIHDLKNQKAFISFKQKIGEMELLIKHEEFYILKAFESDDFMLIRKLEDLYTDYEENLRKLRITHEELIKDEDEVAKATTEKAQKEKEFFNLIANEKESREQLIKCFRQRKRNDINKENGDEKIENEEEFDLPVKMSNQLKNEIINLRDSREHFDQIIEIKNKNITNLKKKKQNLIATKVNYDKRRKEIRDKINANERKKSKYLNLIDISVPLKLDQYCKLEINPVTNPYNLEIYQLPLDISKAVLFTLTKMYNMENAIVMLKAQNKQYEEENKKFGNEYEDMEKSKKINEKELRLSETNFKNEQILKFGLEIDFNNLLKASENTTVDKLEGEYKNMKREADRLIDHWKNQIDQRKSELQQKLKINTKLLEDIKIKLNENRNCDTKLEEKNSEISVSFVVLIYIKF